jgi:hypothetical protein
MAKRASAKLKRHSEDIQAFVAASARSRRWWRSSDESFRDSWAKAP